MGSGAFLFGFNSIKVRLEQRTRFCYLRLLRFQFHKGAIRTEFERDSVLKLFGFNSIKVRLELTNANGVITGYTVSIP